MPRGRPAKSEHGSYAMAQRNGCTCQPCLRARARYMKGLTYDHSRGVKRRQPAEPVRAHVQALLDGGVTETQVALAAGLFATQVANLLRGKMGKPPAQYVLAPTAEKLLAVTLGHAAAQPRIIDGVGVRRRVEALEYMGYTKIGMATYLGFSERVIYDYLKTPNVWSTTRDAVHAMYLELRDTPGPDEASRWRARRRDYKPPMAWDDESIDDPATVPHPTVCIAARCTREVRAMSLCEWHHRQANRNSARSYTTSVQKLVPGIDGQATRRAIAELEELGESQQDIASHLGITEDYIQTLKRRDAA